MEPADRVGAAIAALPVLEEERWRIPGALEMMLAAGTLMPANDRPNLREAGVTKARRQLASLDSLATEMVDLLADISAEAGDALDRELGSGRSFVHFRDSLDATAAAVRRALISVQGNTGVGRPAKRGAAGIADVALIVYEGLTGEKATVTVRADREGNPAGGKFLTFLESLFSALKIAASAETHAKGAIAKAKSSSKTDQ